MKRIPEPELMDSPEQARAYAEADFSDANFQFTELFTSYFADLAENGALVDLGCGPADICIRIARQLPGWRLTGLDAGPNMLKHAGRAVTASGLNGRIVLVESLLPGTSLPGHSFDAVISNSLLHHLPDPATLWESIKALGKPGAAVTVMDLARPQSEPRAAAIVEQYAADAPAVLQEDFYNSLLAAYTPGEVGEQLAAAGLQQLEISLPSDRHWVARGRLAA